MNFEKDDLWNACVALSKNFNDYEGGAHAAIGSQDDNSDFYAWVCGAQGFFYYTKKDMTEGVRPFYSATESKSWGNALIFANRF